MKDNKDKPDRPTAPTRREKLAQALRANLNKRKAQTRARRRMDDDDSGETRS